MESYLEHGEMSMSGSSAWRGVVAAFSVGVVGAGVLCLPLSAQVELHSWTGNFAADGFGVDVAAAGDVDGDGVGDIIVGASQSMAGLLPGYATTFSGRTGDPIFVHTHYLGFTDFGYRVSGVGDVNGDGWDDVAVSYGGSPAGVTVFSGKDNTGPVGGGTVGLVQDIDGGEDVDGDGVPDIIVAASGVGTVVFSGSPIGGVYSYSGGWAVALLGDLNADGHSEFATGGVNGELDVFSGATGYHLYGSMIDLGDNVVTSIDALGDVDGDSVPDFVVGGYYSSLSACLVGISRHFQARLSVAVAGRWNSGELEDVSL